jgi:hypothetical protein
MHVQIWFQNQGSRIKDPELRFQIKISVKKLGQEIGATLKIKEL